MDIVDRLISFKDHTGLSNSQFADKAGIPRPTLSQFLNGRNKRLSDDLTAKLHTAYPELNVLWLLFGEGSMLADSNNQISESSRGGFGTKNDALSSDRQPSDSLNTPRAASFDFEGIHDSRPESELLASDYEALTYGGREYHSPMEPAMYHPGAPQRTVSYPIQSQPAAPVPEPEPRRVKSIMVFYSDNSFERFVPEE